MPPPSRPQQNQRLALQWGISSPSSASASKSVLPLLRNAAALIGVLLLAVSLMTQVRIVSKDEYNILLTSSTTPPTIILSPPEASISIATHEQQDEITTTNDGKSSRELGDILLETLNTKTNGEFQEHDQIVAMVFSEIDQLLRQQRESSPTSPGDDGSLRQLYTEIQQMKQRVFESLKAAKTKTAVNQQQQRQQRQSAASEPCPSSSSTTTTQSSLYALWQEIESAKTRHTHQSTKRVLANVVPRTRPVLQDEITMVTHISANAMDRLILLEKWWGGGPMSVAVWIKTRQHVTEFYQFIREQQQRESSLSRVASYHVLMEYEPEPLYPHNQLRNIAVKYMDTDYFLTNDADIVTKPNAYQGLMKLLRQGGGEDGVETGLNLRAELHSRSIFVLPTFERLLPKGANEVTEDMLPRTKAELVEMRQEQKLEVFYLKEKNIQGPSDYKTWFRNDTDIYYPVDYKLGYEPYILGYRHGAPHYWEPFRGFGWNKQSWFMEADAMDYKFYVLRDFYMVHRNHKSIRRQNKEQKRNRPHWFAYNMYLKKFYNYKKVKFQVQ